MTARSLVGALRGWLLRPRIVHRLPGRLRLRVPALTHIEHAQREWASVWRDLLGGVAEIESVEVNLTSGSVLIRYHPEQLTEAELLAFLRAVNRLALRHWDRLSATPPAKLGDVLERLALAIRGGIRHRLEFDDKIEIPTDVWA